MICPHNHKTLKSSSKWEECSDCHGLWITGESVRKLLGRTHQKNITLLQKHAGKETDLCCPKDGTQLREITMKGVSVDCCWKCEGVWFDIGELNNLKRELKNPRRKKKSSMSLAGDLLDVVADNAATTGLELAADFLFSLLD